MKDKGKLNGIANKMTVLQAIHMPHNTWMRVTRLCIVNCFKKCAMVPKSIVDKLEVTESHEETAITQQVIADTLQVDINTMNE